MHRLGRKNRKKDRAAVKYKRVLFVSTVNIPGGSGSGHAALHLAADGFAVCAGVVEWSFATSAGYGFAERGSGPDHVRCQAALGSSPIRERAPARGS
jgi:hypothetical protein